MLTPEVVKPTESLRRVYIWNSQNGSEIRQDSQK